MVVILIIGVLFSIVMPVLSQARKSAKKKWALKELTELGAVISVYHLDQSVYPPDSMKWEDVDGNSEDPLMPPGFDEFSIHRYLGSSVVNWRGEAYQAYMSMDWKRVIERGPDGAGKFLDPFGAPYELDSMHMIPPVPGVPASGYRQCGWPYLLADQSNPSDQERLMMVLDYKFISYGPDTLTTPNRYPFDMGPGDVTDDPPRMGLAKDDICSWR